jgi:polyhydroxybutyrate depolymerase
VNTGNGETNHDIAASLLIWEFFLKYDINGKIGCIPTAVNDIATEGPDVNMFPNPAGNFLTLRWNDSEEVTSIRIKDILGKEVLRVQVNGQNPITISTQKLNKGIYFSQMISGSEVLYSRKIILK